MRWILISTPVTVRFQFYSSLNPSGEYRIPHVIILVALEENQPDLDVKKTARWLEGIPLLAKWAKVEAVYQSYFTLLLLSVPVPVWNMIPDHPACSFVGFATSPNLVTLAEPSKESERARELAKLNLPTPGDSMESRRAQYEIREREESSLIGSKIQSFQPRSKPKVYESDSEHEYAAASFWSNHKLPKKIGSREGHFKLGYEEGLAEVGTLQLRLTEKDDVLTLANTRIAEKNRTILYLKDYLRNHGFHVGD
ncbi:hypothetical protein N431DRAFT_488665 [Stipitochalara longipes BDJ]|nr:hypothetical protein N431DRAFT_488665 [Stipitochalara longipes BDJ]